MMKIKKKAFSIIASLTMIISLFSGAGTISAAMPEYEIYPTPHKINYKNSDFILRDKVNAVYEDGIDSYTKARLKEVTDIKQLTISTSSELVLNEKVTNILVGIKGSNGYVDQYVQKNCNVSDDLFNKTDSYYLQVNDGIVIVLGKDTDSVFYGLTTLYHIFNQLESHTIRNFSVEDYADVVSRGFIEGYYGNPWATDDRIDLMKWGGYYKLNSYFYAPKDDPKHNANWKELYSDEEIKTKIEPLAKAGNESKCRFVFALHPYMYNAIRYPNGYPQNVEKPIKDGTYSEKQYQEDLQAMQAKFKQVIDAGVRQIAILADDAGNVGADNYIKTLNDMTAWVKEMQKDYPDLKLSIPFCPEEYGGNGEEYYSRMPENIQIVMTGGRVWGEVTNEFTNTFIENTQRSPYLWINWPCSDGSKKHLIMGGYDNFLHPGVNSNNVQGIVLNPMQQSEPSKVAIFGNACYSWNIWETKEEADKAWDDSFKYVDHNSAFVTKSSDALKELSKHMINQNMDSRVVSLEESVDLKVKLESFKESMNANTVTQEQVNELISEFTILQEASKTYRNSGNNRIKNQIIYWLDCWDDTTESALSYLNAISSALSSDDTTLINEYSNAQKAFVRSKTHGFLYIDHNEYAEVGVQHIVPFISLMDKYVSNIVETIANPNKFTQTYISNSFTVPASGDEKDVFDGDDSTSMEFHNPNFMHEGDYIGVKYSKGITVNTIRFLLGGGKNHIYKSKIQYTTDGTTWVDLDSDTIYDRPNGSTEVIEVTGLNLEGVKGVRLISTSNNNGDDLWLTIYSIDINKTNEPKPEEKVEYYKGTLSQENMGQGGRGDTGVLTNGNDGNKNTSVSFMKDPYDGDNRECVPAGATLTLTFDEAQLLGKIYLLQTTGGNKLKSAKFQYSIDGISDWIDLATMTTEDEQTIDVSDKNITAKAIRVYNEEISDGWWDLYEFQAQSSKNNSDNPITYSIIKTPSWKLYAGDEKDLFDNNDNTAVQYDPANDSDEGRTNDVTEIGDFIGYDLGKIAKLSSVHIVVGNGDSDDKWTKYHLEYSTDNINWTKFKEYSGTAENKDIIDEKLNGISARYIRIVNDEKIRKWLYFSEFTVVEALDGKLDKTYVYENVESQISSEKSDDTYSLLTGTVTLNKNEYIGLKLENIKQLDEIIMNYTCDNSSNLKLQVSKNQIIWDDVSDGKQSIDARYIRLMNIGEETLKITLNELQVLVVEVKPESIYEIQGLNIDPYYGANDVRNHNDEWKIFDGDLATGTEISDYPKTDSYVTFDLGKTVAINSLRFYTVEDAKNYIRDAVFEVANTPNASEWTTVLTIGDGVENTDGSDTIAKNYTEYTHDSDNPGNMYKEATGLNVTGKYLRVRFTAPYNHRFAQFNEIIINGGAYTGIENNRDFVGNLEEKGHQPSYMTDSSLSTTYKGSAKNEFIEYFVSEPEGLKAFRIIQNGEVSNADVYATFYNEVTRTTNIVKVGTLSQAINEFIIPNGKKLLSVKVEWKDIIPEIAEIITTKDGITSPNKDNLKALIDKTIDTSKWTANSITAYNNAKIVAENVCESEFVSQQTIDSAEATLKKAIDTAKVKADTTELNKLVAETVINEKGYYTNTSFTNYQTAINEAKLALEDADNLTEEDVQGYIANINTTKAGLIYSSQYREIAKLALEDAVVVEEIYTNESYAAYANARIALENAVTIDENAFNSDDQVNRINPTQMNELTEIFKLTINSLVDVTALKAVIDEFKGYDSSLYTEETYNAYKSEVDAANALLVNGTKESIAIQITAINEKKDALIKKADVVDKTELNSLIAEADKYAKNESYTQESLDKLKAEISKAQGISDDIQATQEQVDTAIADLQKVIDTLEKKPVVDKTALNTLIKEAEEYVKDESYTQDSVDKLNAEIIKAQNVADAKDATQEQVNTAKDNLQKVIDGLKRIVDKKELNKLITKANDCVLADIYTNETLENLKVEIEKAEKIATDKDATQEQVNTAIVDLQTAIDGLVEISGAIDKTELNKLIEEAEKLANDDSYTKESLDKLNAEIEKVKIVVNNDNATKEEVDIAIANLNSMINELEKKPVVDKSELINLIIKASGYMKDDSYTEESLENLKIEITKAQGVADNDKVTNEEVNIAINDLEKMISKLVKKPMIVDKSELKDLITKAINYTKDDSYTKESLDNLKVGIKKAQEVIEDNNVTKDDVKAAINNLNKVISELKMKPKPSPSVKEYVIVEGHNSSIIQGDSVKFVSEAPFEKFEEVLLDGKVLDSKYYTVQSGSTIVILDSEYTKTLSQGKHTVSIVSTDGKATTEFTVEERSVTVPETPSQPIDKTDKPVTDDSMQIVPWVSLIGLSLVCFTMVNVRKRKHI